MRRGFRGTLAVFFLIAMAACATDDTIALRQDFNQRATAYDERIKEIRTPNNKEEQSEVCQYLRVERANKQDGIRQMGRFVPDGDESISRISRSIAIIESRMSEFGCW